MSDQGEDWGEDQELEFDPDRDLDWEHAHCECCSGDGLCTMTNDWPNGYVMKCKACIQQRVEDLKAERMRAAIEDRWGTP